MSVLLLSPDDVKAEHLGAARRAQVCNGIGPALGRSPLSWAAYGLSWPFLAVASAIGLLALYRLAGDDHDARYAVGGDADDKRQADGAFLADLLSLTARWPWPLRWLGWGISGLFTVAVLVGGWGSFRFRSASPYPLPLEALEGLLAPLDPA